MKLFITLLAFLVGCATSNQTVMPDGRAGYSIECSGTAVSMNQCYEKAAQHCPLGYEILSKDESGGWVATTSFAGSTSTKGIMVACKDQAATNELLMKDVKGCMTDKDCDKGKICATARGEYPGSCAKGGFGF